MYVCLCNALTDKKLKQAVDAVGSQKLGDVYEACGCRAQCGNCVKAVLRMVRDYALPPEEEPQAAV